MNTNRDELIAYVAPILADLCAFFTIAALWEMNEDPGWPYPTRELGRGREDGLILPPAEFRAALRQAGILTADELAELDAQEIADQHAREIDLCTIGGRFEFEEAA